MNCAEEMATYRNKKLINLIFLFIQLLFDMLIGSGFNIVIPNTGNDYTSIMYRLY